MSFIKITNKWKPWPTLFIAAVLSFLPGVSSATIVDGVAVKINEDIITISDVQQRVAEFAKAKGITSKKKLKKAEEDIISRMITDKLFLHRAKEMGITVEEKDVELAITDIRKKNGATEEQFKAVLEKNGFTYEQYKLDVKDQIIISKVTGMDIRSKITISEKEIRNYYEKHKSEFSEPEEVKASHILIAFNKDKSEDKARRRAYKIYGQLKKGESFASMARLYSDDGTAKDGGDLGFFNRGMMVSKFEDAAFALRVGEIGEPIKTQFGYHIIKVTDKKAPKPHSLEKAHSSIESKVGQEKYQKKYKEVVAELKAKSYIEILYGPASLTSAGKKEEKRKLGKTKKRRSSKSRKKRHR